MCIRDRTCIAVVIGMQIIQNMISPAIDTLKRDVIGKTAAAIPGIGNAINGVTEVALGTAVLVRNGLGVIGIIVILCVGLPPVIRLGMTTLLYKLLAAIVQPISDKRMVGALATIGDGCMPVSYTHLDVYKRQILPCSGRKTCSAEKASVRGKPRAC